MEKRNVVKMIDLTQFMLMESSGDSEAKSDLGTANKSSSFPRPGRRFVADFDNYFGNYNDDDDNEEEEDDDDAESCSYGSSSHGGNYYARDKENVDHDDGGMSCDDDDDDNRDDDEDDDDAIDSKMVEEVSKKCGGGFVMGGDCTKFLKNEKENDKNFWETCLAS